MSSSQSFPSAAMRVCFLSSYVPRECGIATYTEDVIRAMEPHGADCRVVAMERPGQTFSYEKRVVGTIQEQHRNDYLHAARFMDTSECEVLSLQHEFGIYGGEENLALIDLLDAVTVPVVATLHTILQQPSPVMREHLRRVLARADRVIVMNALVLETLEQVYDADLSRVRVVHHGAPVPPEPRGNGVRKALGLEGCEVLSTFGLISPVKGLEYMVRAMPDVVRRRPNAVYCILGQTHPVVRQETGETYREELERTADELGVADHIRFIDHYLTKDELMQYLLATDTYVTPYLNLEQVTSGTLAYAVGAGCPVVSTPYLHARFLLADDRGLLVPPADADCLARAVLLLLENPGLRGQMEARNWHFGQALYWPQIGAEYLGVFREAAGQR